MTRYVALYTDCSRFLLVRFHIEYLCQQTTARQVLKALETLKSSSTESGQLDFAYGRALRNINNQPKSAKELAFKSLSWLVRARRPLTVEELRIAVSVEPGRYELDKLDLPATETLLHVCGGLVTVDGSTIRLAHYSVQEYLLGNSLIPDDSGFNPAMACTTYLSFDTLAKGPCFTLEAMEDRLRTHPFLDYAARYIGFHLGECDERLSADMCLNFVENVGSISSWYEFLSSLEGFSRWRRHLRRNTRPKNSLHTASLLGHLTVVRLLLEEEGDISAQDIEGETALHLVAYNGHKEVARLLLDKGADITTQNNIGSTALHQAARQGYGEVVVLLLDRGADISSQNNDGDTALHLAACGGHKEVVRLLLNKGADITARDESGSTALHLAAWEGYQEVFRLLLDRGADITTQDSDGDTALHLAVYGGYQEMVRRLLDEGADITVKNEVGSTPLHQAAHMGRSEVVTLLLDRGADISSRDNNGDTALRVVAANGFKGIARLLLERGADVTTKNTHGNTALQGAASRGHGELVKLLLDKGADTAARDSEGDTALHDAALQGHKTVVELLLDRGAIISALNKKGQTALDMAREDNHQAMVKVLLARGGTFACDNDRLESSLPVALGEDSVLRESAKLEVVVEKANTHSEPKKQSESSSINGLDLAPSPICDSGSYTLHASFIFISSTIWCNFGRVVSLVSFTTTLVCCVGWFIGVWCKKEGTVLNLAGGNK